MSFSMIALMVVGGLGLAVQAAMNTRLRVGVQSSALSALISFAVGGAVLALLTLSGVMGRGRWPQHGALPWWAWLGGLLGAFYVTATVVAARPVQPVAPAGDRPAVHGRSTVRAYLYCLYYRRVSETASPPSGPC